ncbi:hypothetical protein G9A89_011529 [Geosiphon pyriformis]|nr:hypothetical protein G9A89_011529 [Geosiphon pyriformis]
MGGPLPLGWEERYDVVSGCNFFIDQKTGESTWDDPRLNHQAKLPVYPYSAGPSPPTSPDHVTHIQHPWASHFQSGNQTANPQLVSMLSSVNYNPASHPWASTNNPSTNSSAFPQLIPLNSTISPMPMHSPLIPMPQMPQMPITPPHMPISSPIYTVGIPTPTLVTNVHPPVHQSSTPLALHNPTPPMIASYPPNSAPVPLQQNSSYPSIPVQHFNQTNNYYMVGSSGHQSTSGNNLQKERIPEKAGELLTTTLKMDVKTGKMGKRYLGKKEGNMTSSNAQPPSHQNDTLKKQEKNSQYKNQKPTAEPFITSFQTGDSSRVYDTKGNLILITQPEILSSGPPQAESYRDGNYHN